MTGAAPMIALTPDAQFRLGLYLHEVRAAVARVPEVNPDEIEADIREHIETEFRDAVRPVTLAELEAVLVRLGPPAQWVPSAPGSAPPAGPGWSPRAWLRQAVHSAAGVLWRGPEDWRLPYLAFGVFALGVVAFPLFPLCLVLSYLLARAARAVAAEKGVSLGARRWLLYPPLVLVAVPLLLAGLFGPVVPAAAGAAHELAEADQFRTLVVVRPDGNLASARPVGDYEVYRLGVTRGPNGKWVIAADRRAYYEALNRYTDAMPGPRGLAHALAVVFAAAGALAAWWVVLGGITWAAPVVPRAVLAPLADGFEARHGRRMFSWAVVAFVLWCGFAYQLAGAAGAEPGAPARPVAPPPMTTK